jgi:hypothetical protein
MQRWTVRAAPPVATQPAKRTLRDLMARLTGGAGEPASSPVDER